MHTVTFSHLALPELICFPPCMGQIRAKLQNMQRSGSIGRQELVEGSSSVCPQSMPIYGPLAPCRDEEFGDLASSLHVHPHAAG